MLFKQKIVLVTGGNTGIGAATVRMFAQEGATVCINYLHQENAAKQLEKEIKKHGGKAWCVRADVSKEKNVKAMMAAIKKRYGRLDVLVNNAGIAIDKGLEELTAENIGQEFAVNAIGAFICSQHAVSLMPHDASIVMISSVRALMYCTGKKIGYGMSKAAVSHLVAELAARLAPKIRVNAVLPGPIDSGWDHGNEEKRNQKISKILLKRLGTPEEIAHAVLFLASPQAGFITGAQLIVDGGSSLS